MPTLRKNRHDPIANSLLAALPRKSYLHLLPGLVPVELPFGKVLYEPGEPIGEVYFPGRSLVSLLTWKCARWGIDPSGSSLYTTSDGVVEMLSNIIGHRDVTSPPPKSCPGTKFDLDVLRQLVKGAL